MKATFIFTLTLLINMETIYAQTKAERVRKIEIASLIIDSQTLKPLEGAAIYDGKGQLLATTNLEGYFKTTVAYLGEGDIKFDFKVKKDGYAVLKQEEHWGNLSGPLHAIFYLGLKGNKSDMDSFSEMETDVSDLSFESVSKNYLNVSEDIVLEQKIEVAKKKNEKVFFQIGNSYYLVNEGGWLKLNTKDDKVQIAGGKIVSADQVNAVVKRKNITGMTPLASGEAAFGISTN